MGENEKGFALHSDQPSAQGTPGKALQEASRGLSPSPQQAPHTSPRLRIEAPRADCGRESAADDAAVWLVASVNGVEGPGAASSRPCGEAGGRRRRGGRHSSTVARGGGAQNALNICHESFFTTPLTAHVASHTDKNLTCTDAEIEP